MNPAGEIERLINPTVEQMGFRVVRVKLFTRPRRTLQVMAERADGSPVVVEECAAISRAVSALLDAGDPDPLPGAYDLEVSSTGIDRPLVRLEDFERFKGFEAQVTVEPAVEGRKRFKGRLIGTEAEAVTMELDDGATIVVPFGSIADAKLVLNDELIAAFAPPATDA